MIEVISLRRDGIERPHFYVLIFRDLNNTNEGYDRTTMSGTEYHLREVLADHGLSEPEIDNLFRNAH
jgi:hypothetical protein